MLLLQHPSIGWPRPIVDDSEVIGMGYGRGRLRMKVVRGGEDRVGRSEAEEQSTAGACPKGAPKQSPIPQKEKK